MLPIVIFLVYNMHIKQKDADNSMTLSNAFALYDEHDDETDRKILSAILLAFREDDSIKVTVDDIEYITSRNLFMCFCEVFIHYTKQISPSIYTLKQHDITRSSGYGTSILKHHRPAIEALNDKDKINFFLSCDEKTQWRISKLTRKTPFAYNNSFEDNTLDDNSVKAAKDLFGLPATTLMALACTPEMKTRLLKDIAGV